MTHCAPKIDEISRLRSTLGDRIVISDGLRSGDTVVLSEPQPAILGMAVEPVFDQPTLVVRVEP